MKKIETGFIKDQYRSGIKNYSDFTKDVGLWASEQYVFQKYLSKSGKILDLGCGTGRTTFSLNALGFTNIIGVDLTPEMIAEAQTLNDYFSTKIDFRIGDAMNLEFDDASFESVIFSFNGIMSIPSQKARERALQEINRVIKHNGKFLFTTHDREHEEEYLEFWEEERQRWKTENQDARLHEFGDLITVSKNESRKIYIHIPNQTEIRKWLKANGFKIIETFYRSDQFQENEMVKSKSGPCRFWVAQKYTINERIPD